MIKKKVCHLAAVIRSHLYAYLLHSRIHVDYSNIRAVSFMYLSFVTVSFYFTFLFSFLYWREGAQVSVCNYVEFS